MRFRSCNSKVYFTVSARPVSTTHRLSERTGQLLFLIIVIDICN